MTWVVEPLAAKHRRDEFQCGNEFLDRYIRELAGQHARKNIGRTFVAVEPDDPQVRGYYTLASSSIEFEHFPRSLQKKLPHYPIPLALIGKLAVHQRSTGKGLGEFLLMNALKRILLVADQIALYAVEVHAIDHGAARFYAHYGFQTFGENPLHLLLPLSTIKQLRNLLH